MNLNEMGSKSKKEKNSKETLFSLCSSRQKRESLSLREREREPFQREG